MGCLQVMIGRTLELILRCHGYASSPTIATFRVNTANVTEGSNGMYAGGGVLGGADALAPTDVGGGIWEGSALQNLFHGGNFAFFTILHMDLIGVQRKSFCADPGNYNEHPNYVYPGYYASILL